MNIKRATVEDAKEILDLQKKAYICEAKLVNDFTIPPLTQTLDEIEKDFEKCVFLKVLLNSKIIGSVRAYEENSTCNIGRLIVDDDYQNRGIGTKLMKEIERLFNNSRRYELFTGKTSDRNIYFYRKLGYMLLKEEVLNENVTLLYLEKLNYISA